MSVLDFGVYIGRFNPPHLGHQEVVNKMLEEHGQNHLVVVGSAFAESSLHNPFMYYERKQLLLQLFPNLNIVGLGDYPNNDDLWFDNLRILLKHHTGRRAILPARGWSDKQHIVEETGHDVRPTFYGGCVQDLYYMQKYGYQHEIINRFTGEIKASATEVKDALIHDRDLTNLLDPVIMEEVQRKFAHRWNKFLSRDNA